VCSSDLIEKEVVLSVYVSIKQEYGKIYRTPPRGFNDDELVVRAMMNEKQAGNRVDNFTQNPRIFPHTPREKT
jgi:hypothetical protein